MSICTSLAGCAAGLLMCCLLAAAPGGCRAKPAAEEIIVYCGVDEPYASQIFAQFEKQTGLHVAPRYDIESSKSVGLAGKLEAERDHPRADVLPARRIPPGSSRTPMAIGPGWACGPGCWR